MRVIITGGTGLIGRRLAASLACDQHEVIVLSRNPARHTGELPAGVQAVEWDSKTAQGWGSLADGAGAIVNLAGENLSNWPWTEERKQRFRNSRIHAGQAVTQAIEQAQNKPGVLIQSSAVGYYGPRGDEPIPPETPPGEDFLARLCVDWEASTATVEALGVRRAIIRTGLVLSTEGGSLPLLTLPFKFFAGGPLGSGNQYYPWIHIADEIAAIRFLIENQAAQGAFNLAGPNPLPNRAFMHTVGRVLNRPSFVPAPGFAMKLALGEMATVVLDGQRAVPDRLQAAGYRFQFESLESALRDLLRKP